MPYSPTSAPTTNTLIVPAVPKDASTAPKEKAPESKAPAKEEKKSP